MSCVTLLGVADKFRIAAGGEWVSSFSSLDEAKARAESLALASGDVVYVARRSVFGTKFVTAFPATVESQAREIWNSTRSYFGGSDGIVIGGGGDGGGGGGDGGGC